MRVITNPGSNLSDATAARYQIEVPPQRISVDGVLHDTRKGVTQATIDQWVRSAKVHPFVLGTSAAEFANIFRAVAEKDSEILSIMSSRKLIGSYSGATAAARALCGSPGYEQLRVEVIDTGSTDFGAGFATVLAAEARDAGLPLREICAVVDRFCVEGTLALLPASLDYLVKGGRASFLRAWIADFFKLTPLITFKDGELSVVEKLSRSPDILTKVVDWYAKRLGEGREVWCAVGHGGDPERAAELARLIAARFDVKLEVVKPIHSSIYMHVGPGALGTFVFPIDKLPWRPKGVARLIDP
jgi:DegV family protein with EDD domain